MRIADYRFKTYHRCLVEKALVRHKRSITGKTLDIGAMRPRYNHLFNASFTAVDLTPNEELGVLYGDIQEGLPFEDNSFDSIICIEVFLYLDQYEKSIVEIHRLLKPGGTAIISTPFMYRDTGDTIRLTERFFLTHFKAYRVTGIPVHKRSTYNGRAPWFKQPVNFNYGFLVLVQFDSSLFCNFKDLQSGAIKGRFLFRFVLYSSKMIENNLQHNQLMAHDSKDRP